MRHTFIPLLTITVGLALSAPSAAHAAPRRHGRTSHGNQTTIRTGLYRPAAHGRKSRDRRPVDLARRIPPLRSNYRLLELDPYRIPFGYDRVHEAIDWGKDLLELTDVSDVQHGTGRDCALAVWNPDAPVELAEVIQVRNGKSVTEGFSVEVVPWNSLVPDGLTERTNGVNTQYRVTAEGGGRWLVVGLKTISTRFGEVVYVPYSPAFQTPIVIAEGLAYLRETIAAAENLIALREVEAKSRLDGLVSEVIDDDVLLTLMIIEHTDKDESIARGPIWAAEKMLTTVALNRADTYRYAFSKAGAGGMAQFMPGTFASIRKGYPAALLPESFLDGMRDHVAAVIAQFCLIDRAIAELQSKGIARPASADLLGTYLAAAYNSGEGHAIRAYSDHQRRCQGKDGACPYTHGLPDETINYVWKFRPTYAFVRRGAIPPQRDK